MMPVCRLIILLVLLFSFDISAQSDKKDKIRTTEHQGVSIELPPLQNVVLRSNSSVKGAAFEFAKRRDVDITPFNSGKWQEKDGNWVWQINIHSPGAYSLNFAFTEYELPEGAVLTIHNTEGQKLGPFTKSDNKDHLQLWTPILSGDQMEVRLEVKKELIPGIKLRLSAVNHGYVDLETRSNSGDCNIDVACGESGAFPLINRYSDQIRSVANIQINGSLICTGFLINTTRGDFAPYVVTAAHCGITDRIAPSTIFYWNYENSQCRPLNSVENGGDGDGLLDQFTSGSTVVSTALNGFDHPESIDFTLLRLNDEVNPNFNPYFLGWDIAPVLPDSSIVIHHPNGEEKRISFDFDPPEFDVINNDSVFVRILNYELGTTERGSSGGPLLNTDGRAIGFVNAGIADCFTPEGFDQYSWLGLAWRNGDSPTTRMKDWIDPDNSGFSQLDGLDGSFSIQILNRFERVCGVQTSTIDKLITVDPNFDGPVQLELRDVPAVVNATLNKTTLDPGENTSLTLENIDQLSSGTYSISVFGTDGINENSNTITIEVIENVPEIVEPQFPMSNQSFSTSLATFRWEGVGNTYDLEISDQIDFSNPIIVEQEIDAKRFGTNSLNDNAEYFWRVRASNFCGKSAWTSPILFRTSALNCNEYGGEDLGLVITEQRNDTLLVQVAVDNTNSIETVSIPQLKGTHSWNSDLAFSLISPAGTTVSLAENLCDGPIQFMDFSLGFDDTGLDLEELPCPFTDGRIYKPIEELNTFQGENPQGIWTLRINDQFEFDGGIVESYFLEICSSSRSNLFTQFSESTLNGCGTNQLESSFEISPDFAGNVMINPISSDPNLVVNLTKNEGMPGESISYTIENLNALEDKTNSIRFILSDGEASSESIVVIDFDTNLPPIDLVEPANNSIRRIGEILDFAWNPVEGNAGYVLEYELGDPNLSNPERVELADNENNAILGPEAIQSNQRVDTLYWRVIAKDDVCDRISETFQFVIDFTDAITEIGDATITIIPNPFESEIAIELSSTLNEDSEVELWASDGSRLQTHRIPRKRKTFQLDVDNLPSGIYFLRLNTTKGSVIEKMVKQ